MNTAPAHTPTLPHPHTRCGAVRLLLALFVLTTSIYAERLPRILAIQGLWNEHYRLPEALSMAGGADLHESLHYHGGSSSGLHFLRGEGQWKFPKTEQALNDFDLIVMTNVGARAFTTEQTAMIDRFVKSGGGLLLLGGFWTLDKGNLHNSGFRKILPVETPGDASRLPHVPEGLQLRPTAEHEVTSLVDWDDEPVTFFFHRLTPRSDAEVVINAGDKPILILGKHGKGRTAVFAGSVNGVPQNGTSAFWKWDDWPQLLANVIEWQLKAERVRPVLKKDADLTVGVLTPEELESLALADDEEKLPLIRKALKACNAEAADALFDELVDNDELPSELQIGILGAILPYAKTAWADRILSLRERTEPPFRRGLLRLLGATRNETGLSYLIETLGINEADTRRAALHGLTSMSSKKAVPALTGFLRRLPPSELDAAIDANEYRDALPTPEDLLADTVIALFRCGAPDVVKQLFDTYDNYLFNEEYASAFFMTYRGPAKSDVQGRLLWKDMEHRLKFMREQIARLETALGDIPESQLGDFVQASVDEDRPHCVRMIYRALRKASSNVKWESLLALLTAKDMGVARMGCAIAIDSGGVNASTELLQQMTRIWENGANNRRRLLMLSRLLPKEQQAVMLRKALADPDPKISRLAGHLSK